MKHLVITILLAGCGASQWPGEAARPQLAKRAAFDLSCPERQLSMTELGNHEVVGVAGCDKRATYIYDQRRAQWVMDSASGDSAASNSIHHASTEADSDTAAKEAP